MFLALIRTKKSDASGKVNAQGAQARATSDSKISIADLLNLVKGDAEKYIPKNHNIRYSLSQDSEGAKFRKKQSKFFEDTKAVDRSGKLLNVENDDIRYSLGENNNYLDSLDKYSQKQYNDFGWARDADAISKNELDDMYSKIHEKGSLKKFAQSSSGEAIIEVNDNPNTTLGADNVFVFVTGTKNNPQINKVVRFQVETDTEMEIIKEKLYERGSFSNTYYSFLRQEGLAREYSKKSSLDYNEYAQKVRRGSRGADSNRAYGNRGSEQNGTRASGETQSNEIAPINETSSKDGVFFDGEKVNYSLSNSEARLSLSEDPIAPTRDGDQNAAMRYNAPVVEDVAPVNETRGSKAEKVVPTAEVYTDDFAPVENLYSVEQEIEGFTAVCEK